MPKPPSIDTGPTLYWRTMRSLQAHFGYFTSAVLNDLVGTGQRKTIEHYLAFLRQEGIIRVIEETRTGGALNYRYAIQRDGDAPPARRSDGAGMGQRQQALWTAMRGLRQFTPSELAHAASTESLSISNDTARSFIHDLKNAGFLDAVSPAHYRLRRSRDTGPRAPIVLRKEQAAFDLNLMRVVNVTAQPLLNDGRAA